jgi:hypothetical protein
LTILSEVVLPQPDGPTRTQILPAGILERQVVDGTMRLLAVAIALGDAAELE